MAAPYSWVERKFRFDFETGVYPAVLMRLRGAPARAEELLGDADDRQVRRRPGEGKWSALERIGHLVEIEALWDARVSDFLRGAETLTPADPYNPPAFSANYNALPAAEVLAAFRTAREALLARLDALGPEDFARTALHPRLKQPLRLVDALCFAAEHDDHELAWVWELLRG
jgi:hypothetical protein